jgi:hypothetical protein
MSVIQWWMVGSAHPTRPRCRARTSTSARQSWMASAALTHAGRARTRACGTRRTRVAPALVPVAEGQGVFHKTRGQPQRTGGSQLFSGTQVALFRGSLLLLRNTGNELPVSPAVVGRRVGAKHRARPLYTHDCAEDWWAVPTLRPTRPVRVGVVCRTRNSPNPRLVRG